jgi:hypothetical protein
MNWGTFPSYTFKKNGHITSRNGEILPIICGKTQVSKSTGVSRNFDHTPDFQVLGHGQRTVEAGVSPAFDHVKQPARLPLQGPRVSQQHAQNIDFAQTTRSIA